MLVCSVRLEPIYAYISYLPLYMGMLLAAIILSILLIDTLLTWQMTRLLRQVELYFGKATPSEHKLTESLVEKNEISAMAHAFSEALDRIENLNQDILARRERELYLEKRRRQSEIIALQSQMDSHLIANIFASMKLLVVQGELAPLRRMIDATGDYLRAGLVHGEYDVPLEREIAHVRAYIAIQCMRFGDRLQVDFQPIDASLYSAMVPKYLLQPIIENAIKHGMRPRSTLHIQISVHEQDHILHVRIENDGIGMAADAAQNLNARLRSAAVSEHIGLTNVSERIYLRFGELYGVHVDSKPEGPTVVLVTLPWIERGD